jgi:hypothetical protein
LRKSQTVLIIYLKTSYVDPVHKNDQQLLFVIHAAADRVEKVELFPLLITTMQVNTATGAAFDEISERIVDLSKACLLYTSPSPRDRQKSRMPSSA